MEEELDGQTLSELETSVQMLAESLNRIEFSKTNPIWAKRSQTFALFLLSRNEKGLHPGELSETMGVVSSRTAALIRDLEDVGLVCCETDPSDNRKKIVCITEKGKEIVKKDEENIRNTLIFLAGKMGVDNLKKFFELTQQVYDAMEEEHELLLFKESTTNA